MGFDERVAALRREIERQNKAWAEVQAAFSQLGDVSLDVPSEFFDELEQATTPRASPSRTVRTPVGIRG